MKSADNKWPWRSYLLRFIWSYDACRKPL